MTSFTWVGERDLRERYAGVGSDLAGLEAWRKFITAIMSKGFRPEALSNLIRALQMMPGRTRPRVFISHRQADVAYGERIAWLASRRAGLDYWLDVHDPVLIHAGATIGPGNPRYPFIIAAIIEMALLNCTHVIAAHTPPRNPGTTWVPSQWIPYEFGRAKSRAVLSRQAAGWFHPGVRPPESRGEYVLLADRLLSDRAVRTWLVGHSRHPIAAKKYLGSGRPKSLP